MNSQDASVCVEHSAAPGSDGAVVRGWGVESIYWCGYLVLWQAGPLNQPAMAQLRRALHAHPHTSGEEASAKPNLINKCSSPVPQLSEMKMILCGSEQSDGDSTGRSRERQKEREKETEWRPKGGTSSKARHLKGKVSLLESKEITRWYILIRTMCLATLPLPDQRAEHLCAGDSLTLIIKNLN